MLLFESALWEQKAECYTKYVWDTVGPDAYRWVGPVSFRLTPHPPDEHLALDSHPGAAFQDWFVNCGLSSLSSAPEVQNRRIKVGLLQTLQG